MTPLVAMDRFPPEMLDLLKDRIFPGASMSDATKNPRPAAPAGHMPEAGPDWREPKFHPVYYITAPVIYALIVPFVLLDLAVSFYQTLCFPAYGIPRVRRRDYIRVDRYRLDYLTGMQRVNCVYCGYVNGLIAYTQEIAARTEAFWCPIKHATPPKSEHSTYARFLEYGDGTDYRARLEAARYRLSHPDARSAAAQPDDDVDLR